MLDYESEKLSKEKKEERRAVKPLDREREGADTRLRELNYFPSGRKGG